MTRSSKDVTRMLVDWSQGRQEVLDELMPLVYDELHRLAGHYLRRQRPGQTLQATALVHEAYLRLVDQTNISWQSRAHFCAIAATAMRHILIEHARRRHSERRGGGGPLSLDEVVAYSDMRAAEFVALDEALDSLARVDPQKSRMVELRFFGGLSIEETAEVLGISPATVKRGWSVAKVWLYREIKK